MYGTTMANERKPQYTALGLIFGTALAAVICLIIRVPIYWAVIGTAVGLIIGAVLDGYRKKGS
jgi:CDP-diglyceride synthetase